MTNHPAKTLFLGKSNFARLIIFITICLVFGATMSIAVAWWATLREWEESEEFVFKENGWKGGFEIASGRTVIGAIPTRSFGLNLAVHGIPVEFSYLTETSPPEWFSLSTKAKSENSMIRGIGAGWPVTCVAYFQEIEDEPFYPEWDFARSGGLIGTNPFDRNLQYTWSRNYLPLRIIPFGLFLDALIFGSIMAIPVIVFRLNLRQRATYHHKRKRCPFCKYDMSHSTSTVCSECGVDSLCLPLLISYSTNVLMSVLTIILFLTLIGFGVVFSNQLPFSKIHYAAYCGDLGIVRSELEAGEDIDAEAYTYNRFSSGNTDTPLMLASANGKAEVVQLLVDSGAALELESSIGATALHMALTSGSLECVMLLLENGADVNAKSYESSDALWFIACNPDNDPKLLNIIIEAGYKFVANSNDVDAAIDIALRCENEKFMNQLLELGGVPGYRALSSAVVNGRVDLLELFVERGADFDNLTEYSWPIFHQVSQDDNPREVIKFLINHGQQINAENYKGLSALAFAAIGARRDLCRILIEFGADPNLRNIEEMNALDYAIKFGNKDVINVVPVLIDAGAEVRLYDEEGKLRFRNINPEVLKLLKQHTASNSNEKQSDE